MKRNNKTIYLVIILCIILSTSTVYAEMGDVTDLEGNIIYKRKEVLLDPYKTKEVLLNYQNYGVEVESGYIYNYPDIIDAYEEYGENYLNHLENYIPINLVSILNETVTIGVGQEYNLVDNLRFNTSDPALTFTFTTDDVTEDYSTLADGKLTSKARGTVTITALVSKAGYISKTVSFEVLVAPVLLSWADPSGEKTTGEQETITINTSFLEGIDLIEGVALYMVWEKKEGSEWNPVAPEDITITSSDGIVTGENGFYKLNEGFVLEDDTSISSNITFNKVGEYKVSVYAIKVDLK